MSGAVATYHHSRRRFLQGALALGSLGLLVGCAIAPPPPAKIHRIALFTPYGFEPSPESSAFRDALRALGYVERENIVVQYRSAQTRESYAARAAELLELQLDAVVTVGNESARSIKDATDKIPVVMAFSSDPVADGLVASLARPGGNVTGLATLSPQLSAKRLELFKEALPAVTRVAVFWNPNDAGNARSLRETQNAAQKLGVLVLPVEVRDFGAGVGAGLGDAFNTAADQRAEAILTLFDAQIVFNLLRSSDLAASGRLPTMHEHRELAQAGGLMSYGPHQPDLLRRAAAYVDRILKGAKPADLPVEQPTTFDFVINLKTAQALGLTIPQSVLLQATEVIQ
jgi:putative ABC transport system substrate-binding protein